MPIALAVAALALPAGASAACPAPAQLKFERKPGSTAGWLSWHRPAGARRTPYRVFRNRTVIGQTAGSRMRVRVSVGHTYWFVVRPVTRRGRAMPCWGELRKRVRYIAPKAPSNLAVTGATGAAAHLTWSPGRRGDGRLAAYRVLRDGATFRQTKTTAIDVPIANDRTYAFSVLSVDSHGRLSRATPVVKIDSGHQAPPTPAGLVASDITESELTLSWAASVPARGRVAAYRVYRDGKVLRQVQGLTTRVTGLAVTSSHEFRVAAVDAAGWLSAPSAAATVTTRPPVPSTGRAHAFLLASTDRSFADFRAHYRRIGTVYPTFFDCSADADLTGNDNQQIVTWARARAVKVLPRFNCQRSDVLRSILTDDALRARWLDQVVDLVERNGYDGANMDFEAGYASDRAAYTSFVTDLAARLHSRGKLLSLAVSAKTADVQGHPRSTFFDYPALARQADTIFVMAWGIHWAHSVAGPQDDLAWLRSVVSYIDTVGSPERFVLGMQLYGMDWPAGGGAGHPASSYEYADLMALIRRVGASPSLDQTADSWRFLYDDGEGVPHEVWYTDATTQETRMRLARDHGLGFGFWRLGSEDQRLWDSPLLAD